MVADPTWIYSRYGQDMSRATPFAVQTVGGVNVFVPSLNKQVFNGDNLDGTEVIITGASYTVSATDTFLILNKTVAAPTTIQLPSVVVRQGTPLIIFDFGGNAGDITILPGSSSQAQASTLGVDLGFGSSFTSVDTIAGLPSAILTSNGQGLGTAAFVILQPVTSLLTWVQIA